MMTPRACTLRTAVTAAPAAVPGCGLLPRAARTATSYSIDYSSPVARVRVDDNDDSEVS